MIIKDKYGGTCLATGYEADAHNLYGEISHTKVRVAYPIDGVFTSQCLGKRWAEIWMSPEEILDAGLYYDEQGKPKPYHDANGNPIKGARQWLVHGEDTYD